jgi:hypothetical protein
LERAVAHVSARSKFLQLLCTWSLTNAFIVLLTVRSTSWLLCLPSGLSQEHVYTKRLLRTSPTITIWLWSRRRRVPSPSVLPFHSVMPGMINKNPFRIEFDPSQ